MRRVTLTGDGAKGLTLPSSADLTVCLGAVRPRARPAVPRFDAFWAPDAMTSAPPPSVNRRVDASESLSRMYCNDRMGCCVISGKAHNAGLWSGADQEVAVVVATDAEIVSQYNRLKAGPGDSGCIITHVLDYCRATGFLATSQRYKIDGYVACDNKDKLQTQTVQYLFGASTIGINLPEEWTTANVWDVTSSKSMGGHDVSPIDYDERGVYVSSWGRMYLMTWAAWMDRRYVTEYYAVLAPLWYGSDRMAPCGVDVAGLKKAMAQLQHGEIPEVPEGEEPDVSAEEAAVASIKTYDSEKRLIAVYDRRDI